MRELKRRAFTQEASLAFLAGIVVVVSDCGGGGGGSNNSGDDGYGNPVTGTPPTTVASGDESASISANHGHVATITSAQMQTGGALSLNIEGTAGHNHVVALVAQAVADVRDGRKIRKESTLTDVHTHMVTFNADASGDPIDY